MELSQWLRHLCMGRSDMAFAPLQQRQERRPRFSGVDAVHAPPPRLHLQACTRFLPVHSPSTTNAANLSSSSTTVALELSASERSTICVCSKCILSYPALYGRISVLLGQDLASSTTYLTVPPTGVVVVNTSGRQAHMPWCGRCQPVSHHPGLTEIRTRLRHTG